jgi:transposase
MARGKVGIRKKKIGKGYFDYYLRRQRAAAACSKFSYTQSADIFGLTIHQIRYWVRKRKHNDTRTQGGRRYSKLTDLDKRYLYELGRRYPQSSLTSFNNAIQLLTQSKVSNATISLYFKQIGWSYHKVEYKQKLKYTSDNLQRYLHHVLVMPDIVKDKGLSSIKYLDEVHFVTKQLQKQKGVGPKSKSIVVKSNCNLSETYSMTLLTNLKQERPYNACIRSGSNTQFDFGVFICQCIRSEYLGEGDILVMDNASVHVGQESFGFIIDILERVGITLYLLPTYSPELNPAEYVFAFIKNNLRSHRDSSIPLWKDIMHCLSKLTPELLESMYVKCIYHPNME